MWRTVLHVVQRAACVWTAVRSVVDSQKAKTEIYFGHCCYVSGPNSSCYCKDAYYSCPKCAEYLTKNKCNSISVTSVALLGRSDQSLPDAFATILWFHLITCFMLQKQQAEIVVEFYDSQAVALITWSRPRSDAVRFKKNRKLFEVRGGGVVAP